VAEEMVALGESEGSLAEVGLHTWLPTAQAVQRCVDKWQFANTLEGTGLPYAPTSLGSQDDLAGPWVVKPRFGRGSRDVYFVEDQDELRWALRRVPEPIVQTRLEGREFTVDALVDHAGELAGAVPRWRTETKAGISTKGVTFANDDLVHATGEVLHACGLTGPANVQGFVAPSGDFSFVEVNPRFSGGLPLSLAAGADLVGEYLRGIFGLALRRDRLSFRPGVTMLRHFEEIFEG
jgi:carbamoyl-phosphate synthase large subunit